MLEEGKVYLLKTTRGSVWLFKKYLGGYFRNHIAGCDMALCLDDMYKTNNEGYVCRDTEIAYIKRSK